MTTAVVHTIGFVQMKLQTILNIETLSGLPDSDNVFVHSILNPSIDGNLFWLTQFIFLSSLDSFHCTFGYERNPCSAIICAVQTFKTKSFSKSDAIKWVKAHAYSENIYPSHAATPNSSGLCNMSHDMRRIEHFVNITCVHLRDAPADSSCSSFDSFSPHVFRFPYARVASAEILGTHIVGAPVNSCFIRFIASIRVPDNLFSVVQPKMFEANQVWSVKCKRITSMCDTVRVAMTGIEPKINFIHVVAVTSEHFERNTEGESKSWHGFLFVFAANMSSFLTPNRHGYSVRFSPFDANRLVVGKKFQFECETPLQNRSFRNCV